MTGQAGPTLTFDGPAWAHLREHGRLSWAPTVAGDDLPIRWCALARSERLALYRALVRGTVRGERAQRQKMADVLHLLGRVLIPEEGDR